MDDQLSALLKQLEASSFLGKSDYYPTDDESAHMRFEYSLRKFVIKNKSPLYATEIVNEIAFTPDYRVAEWKESVGNQPSQTFSQEEIESMDRNGILWGQFLFKDPRCFLRHNLGVEKLEEGVYRVKVWERNLFFKKVTVYVELYVAGGMLKRLRKYSVINGKEVANQSFGIEFEYP